MTSSSTGQNTARWEILARPGVFAAGVFLLLAIALLECQSASLGDGLDFLIVSTAALLPAGLWCARRACGLPIYPIFALGAVWTFALPFITNHPLVRQYEPGEKFSAAVLLALTLSTGTAVWYALTCHPPPFVRTQWQFRPGLGDLPFFTALATAAVFNVLSAGYLDGVDASLVSLVRAVIIAISNLAIFVLAYKAGQGGLRPGGRQLFTTLLVLLMISSLASVLLINALVYGALAAIGLALGRGRLPWLMLVLLLGAALYLQAGKAAIREKYWFPLDATPITIGRYPAVLGDWIGFSWSAWTSGKDTGADVEPDGENQSFLERASLLHLFLQIQRLSPGTVPYLHGATYAIVPGLLVPRVLAENKARSHLGTYMLAIHYQLQEAEDTYTTTIGFGLINEALANFGPTGCLGLGAALGFFYGMVARWSARSALLSFRALFSILVLTLSFQNEFTAGVFLTTLFQGGCALLLLALLTMGRVTFHPWSPPFSPAAT